MSINYSLLNFGEFVSVDAVSRFLSENHRESYPVHYGQADKFIKKLVTTRGLSYSYFANDPMNKITVEEKAGRFVLTVSSSLFCVRVQLVKFVGNSSLLTDYDTEFRLRCDNLLEGDVYYLQNANGMLVNSVKATDLLSKYDPYLHKCSLLLNLADYYLRPIFALFNISKVDFGFIDDDCDVAFVVGLYDTTTIEDGSYSSNLILDDCRGIFEAVQTNISNFNDEELIEYLVSTTGIHVDNILTGIRSSSIVLDRNKLTLNVKNSRCNYPFLTSKDRRVIKMLRYVTTYLSQTRDFYVSYPYENGRSSESRRFRSLRVCKADNLNPRVKSACESIVQALNSINDIDVCQCIDVDNSKDSSL